MSTKDQRIPAYLKGYDTTQDPLIEYFPSDGSSFVRDVALYMRTTDLRSSSVGKIELPGMQNIILYVVYAMGNNPDGTGGCWDAGRDKRRLSTTADGRIPTVPVKRPEWDKNGDVIYRTIILRPRTGYKLEKKLMDAILAILQRAGSGTAVSVLATKGEGEGTLVQAIFDPSTPQKRVRLRGPATALPLGR